jgi:hypothetical protein
MMIRTGISVKKMENRTVLDAVGAPLAFRDLAEYRGALPKELVDDPVLGALLKTLKAALKKITRV